MNLKKRLKDFSGAVLMTWYFTGLNVTLSLLKVSKVVKNGVYFYIKPFIRAYEKYRVNKYAEKYFEQLEKEKKRFEGGTDD